MDLFISSVLAAALSASLFFLYLSADARHLFVTLLATLCSHFELLCGSFLCFRSVSEPFCSSFESLCTSFVSYVFPWLYTPLLFQFGIQHSDL